MIKQKNLINEMSKSNNEPKHIKFKFSKDRVIAETEKTLLVCISENIEFNGPAVWVSKKIVYANEWSNYVKAYVPEGFDFNVENVKTKSPTISVEKLKELIAVDNL